MNDKSEIQSDNRQVDALIIGRGALVDSLKENLEYRHLTSDVIRDQRTLDLSCSPNFIFWFSHNTSEQPSELLLNFCHSLDARLTIVYIDRECDQAILTRCIDADVDARMVSVIDLYGPGVFESSLALVWSAIPDQQLIGPENDDERVFPLYLDDAASALCLIAFSSQTYNRVLTISGGEEMSVVNFIYRVKEESQRQSGRVLSVGRSPATLEQRQPRQQKKMNALEARNLISWQPETNVSEGVERLVRWGLRLQKERSETPSVTSSQPVGAQESLLPESSLAKKKIEQPKAESGSVFFRLIFFATVGLTLAILPLLVLLGAQWRVSSLLETQQRLVTEGTSSEILSIQRKVYRWAEAGDIAADLSGFTATLFGQRQAVQSAKELFRRAPIEAEIDAGLGLFAQDVSALTSGVVGASTEFSQTHLYEVESGINNLLTRIGGALNTSSFKDHYVGTRKTLSLGRDLLPFVRWMLGFDQKRTLLLVIQDAGELRPSGGFMKNLMFATFERGKLLDVNSVDIYQIDAQLVGHEDPPEPIRRLLGETAWLARDANWSPDGPTVARHLARLVSRAAGRSIDGVVFLTTHAVREMLSASGPVVLSSGETVSADTIIDRSTFTDDATQIERGQPNVLVDVLLALRNKLEKGSGASVLGGVIKALSREEAILISFDPQVARTLALAGVDGAVRAPTCPLQFRSSTCVSDSLFIVDSNLGVNRADYFLRRERSVEVEIAPSEPISTTLTLTYTNTATSSTRPAGAYRGYTRIMAPIGSIVKSAVDASEDTPVAVVADHDVQFGMRVIGFDVQVPIGQKRTYRLTFTSPTLLPLEQGIGGYHLFVQKQPGVDAVPTSLELRYASTLRPAALSPEAKQTDSSLRFFHPGDQNFSIAVEFESLDQLSTGSPVTPDDPRLKD